MKFCRGPVLGEWDNGIVDKTHRESSSLNSLWLEVNVQINLYTVNTGHELPPSVVASQILTCNLKQNVDLTLEWNNGVFNFLAPDAEFKKYCISCNVYWVYCFEMSLEAFNYWNVIFLFLIFEHSLLVDWLDKFSIITWPSSWILMM